MYTTEEITTDAEQLYDMSYVNKICRNDAAKVKKMVDVFIKTIPAAVEEMKQQYSTGDFASLKKTAHRIKPVILIYAIVKAEKVVVEIEMMAKNEFGLHELGAKIAYLGSAVDSVVSAMKNEFDI